MASAGTQSLQRLDELLKKLPHGTPGSFAWADSPDYSEAFQNLYSVDTRLSVETEFVFHKASEVVKCGDFSGRAFRLCSVGCGEGHFDRALLERLTNEFPRFQFHYWGCDLTENVCEKARQRLKSLPQTVKVTVDICDYEKLEDYFKGEEKFDLVFTVHTLYYTHLSTLPRILSTFLSLVAQQGMLVIIVTSKSGCNELQRRFWMHEKERPFLLISDVMNTLQKMGIDYTHDQVHSSRDLSQCFKDDFTSVLSSAALNFLAHTDVSSYPSEVRDTCVAFLKAVVSSNFCLTITGESLCIVKNE